MTSEGGEGKRKEKVSVRTPTDDGGRSTNPPTARGNEKRRFTSAAGLLQEWPNLVFAAMLHRGSCPSVLPLDKADGIHPMTC